MAEQADNLVDLNGRAVYAFTVEMTNLGFQRMADKLVGMLDSGAWQDWRDGLGRVALQPGEFDYFLSLCGVTREMVMTGIRDMEAKARLAESMDERRAGEDGYRRRFDEVRGALGRRKAEPFGYTQAEGSALSRTGFTKTGSAKHRAALGDSVRRFITSGDPKPPAYKRTRLERLEAAIRNLGDDEFAELCVWLSEHRRERAKPAAGGR